MDLEIDRLGSDDLDDAAALSTAVGWNQTETDWRRLLELYPGTCFAGRVEGELVATSTLAAYDDVGWIGMVLVDAAHRRRGYGSALFERALEAGRDRELSILGLDATDAGRTVYSGYGFEEVGGIDRWRGSIDPDESTTGDPSATPIANASVDGTDVARFDRERTGVDRRRFLAHLLDSRETSAFVRERGGELRGYAVVRPGRTAPQLGPIVAVDEETSRGLFEAIASSRGVASTENEAVIVDAPRSDRTTALLRRAGLEVRRELHRMVDADASDRDAERRGVLDGVSVWAAGGFEWG